MTKKEVLNKLLALNGKLVSGESLASELGVSRMAISKAVNSLKDDGYPIIVKERKGYMLSSFDLFKKDVVLSEMTSVIKTYFYESLRGSSNNEAKAIAASHKDPFLVVTAMQEGGKGRLGRSFSSPLGGLYFSLYLPSDMLADGDLITTNAALACALAIEEESGHDVQIKWVNDIYMGGKKLVGILTEGIVDLELGGLSGAIIGIGINVNTDLSDYPDELKGTITSLKIETGREIDRVKLLKNAVEKVIEFQKKDYLDEYRKRCFVLGKSLTVNKMGRKFEAKAVDIDDRARLIVEYEDGKREALSSAEVTLHKE